MKFFQFFSVGVINQVGVIYPKSNVMLLQIYIKLDNSSAKLKEITTQITRNHNSASIKQQYNLTDKEIRLLIDLEVERRQQADRKNKINILQQYKKQAKQEKSAAAKKRHPGYGRHKTAAAILRDRLLIVAPLINLFKFIRSGGGLWGKFNPVFSSQTHQAFKQSAPQAPGIV
ncbi:MAG: hypothetical protein GY820_10895 [Gammaproteobacteria bacterium]|nr:hypothetical protein [Gammaproteobacteria bacterium]